MKSTHKLLLMSRICYRVAFVEEVPNDCSGAKMAKLVTDGWCGGVSKSNDNLMILTFPFFKTINVFVNLFVLKLNRFLDIASDITPKFTTFKKTGYKLSPTGLEFMS